MWTCKYNDCSCENHQEWCFQSLLDPLTSSAGSLISSCRLVLTTPLSSCNATLSTQPFSSALQV
ncbi:unnamed protein product, partial [Prunus brigantina]